jgi:hypothetical protein
MSTALQQMESVIGLYSIHVVLRIADGFTVLKNVYHRVEIVKKGANAEADLRQHRYEM